MQELWGWDDDPCSDENRIGNAFLHAWLVCKAAQSGSCISVLNGPGLLGPLEYWFLHEEYTKNTCTQAAMDFHNDQQGYAVGLGSTEDCTDLVLDAMAAGNLRWRDADTPACRWELDAEDHECWPE